MGLELKGLGLELKDWVEGLGDYELYIGKMPRSAQFLQSMVVCFTNVNGCRGVVDGLLTRFIAASKDDQKNALACMCCTYGTKIPPLCLASQVLSRWDRRLNSWHQPFIPKLSTFNFQPKKDMT